MMFRLLLITLLVGLTCAAWSNDKQQQSRRVQHHNHRRPVHRKPAPRIIAVDQIIKRKPAVHFLGRNFIRKALSSQPGDNKYLRLTGKENRDINGTITINKKNVLIDLVENKDGHFLVTNKRQKVVGRVDMYSGNMKHLTVKNLKNGDQVISGYHTGNGHLDMEQDVLHRGRYGKTAAAKKHLKVVVNQNHYTSGHIEVTDIKRKQQQTNEDDEQPRRYRRSADSPSDLQQIRSAISPKDVQQIRYRRQAVQPVDAPCRELNCLNAVQI